uniref:SNF1-related protein kinase regulatory subunit gamma-1-like n=1 Tax=Ananas comosus var. bracteatus TaxID=296719 RepID=A0A6V7QJ17_ANACO|nr:unnamed protein product [Ananas comosus var. bracteatus]
MEVVMKKAAFKEEIKDVELMGDEDNGEVPPTISRERSPMDNSIKPSPADTKVNSITQLDRLEMTKAEMGEVREENERLKMILARIVKDYQSLHVQFLDIFQQDQAKKLPNDTSTNLDDHIEDQELVSLSLGTSSSGQKKEDKLITVSKNKEYDEPNGGGLTLGLECKFEGSSGDKHEVPMTNVSSDNSFEEAKEVEAGEPWPPSKIFKNIRSGEDEVLQQPQVKKARVSVRARCDAPTVQRCAQDTSILITTYEGTHNHPLPISATAMASTTSAAASMLMSGSSASSPAIGSHTAASAAATTTLNGLKFSLADPSKTNQLIYFPTPSLSSAASHPTITLDLTAPSSSSSSSASQPSFFSTFSSNPNPRFSPTGFNFSTSETGSTTATLPPSWTSGYLSYASPLHIKSPIGCLNLGSKAQDLSYQSCMQKIANPSAASPGQNSLTDTIAKAITADPSFRSALATAITSYVGAQGGPGDGRAQGLKWGDQLGSGGPIGGSGCASSYLTNSGSPASKPGQHGSLLLPQPTLGFASSKSNTTTVEAIRVLSEHNILAAPVTNPHEITSTEWKEHYLGIIDYPAIILWVLESAELAAAALTAGSATAAGVGAGALGALGVGAVAMGATGPLAVAGLTVAAIGAAVAGGLAAESGMAKDAPAAADSLGDDFYKVLLQEEPFKSTTVKSILQSFHSAPFIPVAQDSSMLTVLLLLSKYRLKNVPVIEDGKPYVKNFITQSAVVQGLNKCKGCNWFDFIAARPLSDFGLPFMSCDEVISIKSDELILEAFKRMKDNQIGGLPVTEGTTKKLVGSVSIRDIRFLLLKPRLFSDFRHLTVLDFIKTITSAETELANTMANPATCAPTTCLGSVIESLASRSAHRIYVVEGTDQEIVGVVTLRDVISCFVYEPSDHFNDYFKYKTKEALNW